MGANGRIGQGGPPPSQIGYYVRDGKDRAATTVQPASCRQNLLVGAITYTLHEVTHARFRGLTRAMVFGPRSQRLRHPHILKRTPRQLPSVTAPSRDLQSGFKVS